MASCKKILIVFLLIFFLSSGLVDFAFAAERELEVPIPGLETTTLPALPDYIIAIYNFALMIIGLICFGALLYGGFRYLTSAGNPAAMADAKDQIFSALLGLIILFSSYLILTTINPELVILGEPKREKCTSDADCPEGLVCVGGICSAFPVLPGGTWTVVCNDSDGNKPGEKGTCTDSVGSYADSCTDDTHLTEYICSESACTPETIDCGLWGQHCENGACVFNYYCILDESRNPTETCSQVYAYGYYLGPFYSSNCDNQCTTEVTTETFICCSECWCKTYHCGGYANGTCGDCTSDCENAGATCRDYRTWVETVSCIPKTAIWESGFECPTDKPGGHPPRYCDATTDDDETACKNKCQAEGYSNWSYSVLRQLCTCSKSK